MFGDIRTSRSVESGGSLLLTDPRVFGNGPRRPVLEQSLAHSNQTQFYFALHGKRCPDARPILASQANQVVHLSAAANLQNSPVPPHESIVAPPTIESVGAPPPTGHG